ncbi:DUF1376 domain-containing protein [Rhizorhabdus wittichii]|uniref:DUF1376 domain-containing protein n=1 Tax=Rhizorhabdus wittichii TaxID=160791 RepID=A0A975CYR6_9SPHN|nr:DUF1376 domain-containing protein [Rhizorhabdus wittichii]QTH19772.1 DUF1376 domain-containing protein [Rhizorhabdus wittichii]
MSAPAPLTPPDCDLRGLPFMPLDVIRLVDSDLAALSTGEEFKAAVVLWCKSWVQVPAASLPDDDRILAHLSGAGARWKKIRTGALRGFVKCSDGRLYHPVVAEKAIEALPARQEYREKKSGESERKQREREARREMFDQLRAAGVTAEWNIKTSDLRALVTQHVTTKDVTPVTPVTEQVTAKTGTGTGTGTDSNIDDDVDARAPALGDDPPSHDPITLAAELCRIGGVRHLEPNAINRHVDQAREWLSDGFDPDTEIIPAIRDAVASATTTIHSLKFFDPSIRQARARKEAHDHGHEPQARNRAGRAGAGGGGGLCASPAEAILAARRNLGIDR